MAWPINKVVSWWRLPLNHKIMRPFDAPLWKRMLFAILLQVVALVGVFASHLGLNMTKHILAAPPVQRLVLAFLVAAVVQSVLLWLIWRWALSRGVHLPRRRLVGRIIGGVAVRTRLITLSFVQGLGWA